MPGFVLTGREFEWLKKVCSFEHRFQGDHGILVAGRGFRDGSLEPGVRRRAPWVSIFFQSHNRAAL